MSSHPIQQYRPFFILGIILILWLFLPVALKRKTRSAFHEFQAPVWIASSQLNDLQSFWALKTRDSRDLIEAGRTLSRINAGFQAVVLAENRALRDFNERLRTLLGIPEDPRFRFEIARVVRRDLTSWWQRITVRKGADYGVTVGNGVIFREGIVGRVVEVHAYTSVIELVSSPTFRMAARFQGDRRPVRFNGNGSPVLANPGGAVRDVPSDLTAVGASPLILESTRLGGVFPDGLRIGEVPSLETGTDGLFQRGPVILSRELLTLEEVTVLVPFGTSPTSPTPDQP